jgi:hypothetical protein
MENGGFRIMAEIWTEASNVAPDAVVLGWYHSDTQPKGNGGNILSAPQSLTRIYQGYGQLRAETGKSPRRGFGELIGDAAIKVPNDGKTKLWLKVID